MDTGNGVALRERICKSTFYDVRPQEGNMIKAKKKNMEMYQSISMRLRYCLSQGI